MEVVRVSDQKLKSEERKGTVEGAQNAVRTARLKGTIREEENEAGVSTSHHLIWTI